MSGLYRRIESLVRNRSSGRVQDGIREALVRLIRLEASPGGPIVDRKVPEPHRVRVPYDHHQGPRAGVVPRAD